MSVATELERYLADQGVDARDPWYRMPVFGRRLPVFRITGRQQEALTAHDAHHLLTGYDTGLKGECELCAWELGSGGCHTYGLFWLDRLLFLPIAILCAPVRFAKAFWRGLGARNLYRIDAQDLLSMEVAEARRMLGRKATIAPGSRSP